VEEAPGGLDSSGATEAGQQAADHGLADCLVVRAAVPREAQPVRDPEQVGVHGQGEDRLGGEDEHARGGLVRHTGERLQVGQRLVPRGAGDALAERLLPTVGQVQRRTWVAASVWAERITEGCEVRFRLCSRMR
jgi:hypothetical protein